ncbi:unnamed protein product, partial [Scytosiphon promiscuus]
LFAPLAGLFVDGLTQTCAALRRRIAELEADNSSLRKQTSSHDSKQNTSSSCGDGNLDGSSPRAPAVEAAAAAQLDADAAMMSMLSPSAKVLGERTGGGDKRRGPGFKSRGRVSSVPRRDRYSFGVSRFSLPSNLSPGRSNAAASTVGTEGNHLDGDCGGAAAAEGEDASWRREAGGLWEGLSLLTHPLTGDDKNLTFMEFAVVGVAQSALAGSQALQPWGQDPEVLAGFPAAKGYATGVVGRGKGDGSFVQGLGDFCFPCGANLALVNDAEGASEAVPDDRVHLVQFTDCENASTYGCCLTVTEVLQNPSPRLIKRLRDRERLHSAAKALQRFMQAATASSPGASRRRWQKRGSGGVADYGYADRPTTPLSERGERVGRVSRFRFQTPPPGSGDGSGDMATPAPGDPAAASEASPTSFSGMINRLFSSSPGVMDGGSSTTPVGGSPAGREGDESVAGAAIPAAPVAATATATVEPLQALSSSSRSPAKGRPRAPATPLRKRPPSSPCPANAPSQLGDRSPGTGRSRSAGYSDGGGAVRPDAICMKQFASSGGGGGAREDSVPGMFSDDESESDAGCSPDRDAAISASPVSPPANTSAHDAGVHDNGNHDDSRVDTHAGAGVLLPTAVDEGFEGSDNNNLRLDFGHGLHGSPMAKGEAEEPETAETPPGVTMRTRLANPRAVAAAVAATTVRREEPPRWSVLVEKCYVMVSCHRNHPLMFKVLKTIADAERSSGRSAASGMSSFSPPSRASRGTRPPGLSSSLSPPRTRIERGSGGVGVRSPIRNEVDGVYCDDGDCDEGNGRQLPRTGSTFRCVAAAAAEEAKGRHRRMLRDKFLHQVQTDKSCTEEGKKVSLHCPAYLRGPLEVTPTSLEQWSTAVLFSCVSEEATLQALDVLLLEKTLVVCGRDLGMVSMAATALLSLLDPFEWEGVFVPVVPMALMDVLDSPVPALVGVQSPFDSRDSSRDGVVVLDLDARNGLGQVLMEGMDERPPVSNNVVTSLKSANTFRGRARGSGSSIGRSTRRTQRSYGNHSLNDCDTPTRAVSSFDGDGGASGGGAHVFGKRFASASAASPSALGRGSSTLSPGPPRSHFAFQASTFMSGLTLEEKGSVLRLRSVVRGHVSALCGDLEVGEMWRKYGAFNSATRNFDFHPDWFTEPLEARLRFQVAVARTQMFVSFVDRCRQKDTKQVCWPC